MTSTSARARRALLSSLVAIGCVAGATTGTDAASAASVCPGSMAATDTNTTDIGCYLFLMVNQERAAHGLPAVSSTPPLRLAALRHDEAMQRYNTLSHQLPGESTLVTRYAQAGFSPCAAAGENVAYNTDRTWRGAQYVENLMYNETAPNNGHRLNILYPHFNRIGITVLMDATHAKMWITFDFAQT